jgi:biotin carboxyl carrier protein
MKLLNTIAAEQAGKIIDICVADGATIEAGQVLMVIEL